jgi:T5SS/PEP-CTERM-associated repeat protein
VPIIMLTSVVSAWAFLMLCTVSAPALFDNGLIRRKTTPILCLVLGCSLSHTKANAATMEWNQPAFGVFGYGDSWGGSVAPSASDSVIYGSKATTVNTDIEILFTEKHKTNDNWFASGMHHMTFSDSGSIYAHSNLENNGYPASYTAGRVVIGSGSREYVDGKYVSVPEFLPSIATLRLASVTPYASPGSVESSTLTIGGPLFDKETNPTEGVFIVEGAGSLWTNKSSVHIGTDGNRGQFTVRDGARYRNTNITNGFSTDFVLGGGSSRGSNDYQNSYGSMMVSGSGTEYEIDTSLNIVRGVAGFTNRASGKVNSSGRVQLGALSINSNASLHMSGSLTLSNAISTLDVKNGGELSVSFLDIAGTAIVDNGTTGSRRGMTVGNKVAGVLRVQNGGRLTAGQGSGGSTIGRDYGVRGEASISGKSSLWTTRTLNIGGDGEGYLTIERGGEVDTNRDTHVGRSASGYGTVVVKDVGSRWTQDNMTVGTLGKGEVRISNGGAVSSGDFVGVGLVQGSNGYVSVHGASMSASGQIDVGISGEGTMDIKPGGSVSSRHGAIATKSGSIGTVKVSGNTNMLGGNAHWNIEKTLIVGGNYETKGGTGALIVESGAAVRIGEELVVWENSSVDVLSGGSLTVGGTNGTVLPGTVQVLADSKVSGAGEIRGNLINSGIISPGHSPGVMSIDGDFTQLSNGILTLEVGGLASGEYDVLAVEGNVLLGGKIELLPLVDIPMGMSFDFVSSSNEITNDNLLQVGSNAELWSFERINGQRLLRATALKDIAAVPEPSCFLLSLLSGIAVLGTMRRELFKSDSTGSP